MKKLLVLLMLVSIVGLQAGAGCCSKKTMAECDKTKVCKTECETTMKSEKIKKHRKTEYAADDIFVNRWSRYAMSGESVSDKELNTLFEAARWAQSSYNNQPWRFIYAKRDTKAWDTLFDTLVEFNQQWCKNAGALIAVVSKETFDWNKPSRTHSFDTGAACMNFALQGSIMGLAVHGMEGFDYDKLKKALHVPDGYAVEAMFAVGRPAETKTLPKEMQEKDMPSTRKSIEEFAFEGAFKN